jgi:hypothetical protein
MSRHRERIGRLVTWIKQHMELRPPLVVYHSDTLPATPPEEIEAAQAEGRRVLNVHFVKPGTALRPGSGPEVEPRSENGRGARSSED